MPIEKDLEERFMQKNLPEQITREQFEVIRPVLESGFKKTKPQKVDRFRVF
jgi:hypothetical protein